MRAIRSLLFAPANQPALIRKFHRYPADAYAIDLEDGTPEGEKAAARNALAAAVAGLREQALGGLLFVRTNEPQSPHIEADLAAALATPIDGIIVPKLAALTDLEKVSAVLRRAEERRGSALGLVGLIETALGVASVEKLASSGNAHLAALAFGAEDFVTDMRGRRTREGLEVLYARSRIVLAARAAGIGAVDQAFTGIRDDEGFRRDAEVGRRLGYDGKLCVVPRQIEIANDVFAPTAEEIAHSRRLIEAVESARAEGRGVIDFEGGMVDAPVIERARTILELAERLGER